jgi:hypothetical protein
VEWLIPLGLILFGVLVLIWARYEFRKPCERCEVLSKMVTLLENDAKHYQELSQTLAEKINYRPSPPAPVAAKETSEPRKSVRGANWGKAREQLERLSSQ